MSVKEIAFVDLSSIAHPIWHTSQAEPDPNFTSRKIVQRVRELTSNHPHAGICCDSGRSFRADISPAYKANRPERDATLHHQIDLAKEQLEADGFPIWAVRGFEADDLIASGVQWALDRDEDATALVISADKDLLQLVSPRVRVISARDGKAFGIAEVVEKFGIGPEMMRDYLTLVGDASDNVRGCNKVGPKTAVKLLAEFGTIEAIYAALDSSATHPAFTPALRTNLLEFREQFPKTRQLITLRTDVQAPYEQAEADRIAKEREAALDMPFEAEAESLDMDAPAQPTQAPISELVETADVATLGPSEPGTPTIQLPRTSGIALREPNELAPVPADYERQLDPRSMAQAIALAKNLHASRMFDAYGTPHGVLAAILTGRELGLPAMASVRGLPVIEGKIGMYAQTMVALVLKSGLAEFFEPVSFDLTQATFVTKRVGARKEVTMSYTVEYAIKAGLMKKDSNWEKRPEEMCISRAQARLCRLVYPDILGGLYTPEELREIAEERRAA